ncbi:hypothetical protein B0537_08460 [Desulforamulus ferrireducens]|uniref:Uncharacterized protein n=2 Tax=Desulforamulus ferrireducens TaxID=1833852 RepID=A0A1S6IWG3_9FIRM|nr:hypothetical protein B0537_08460 [Desulforamulus ferrireducens]
MKFRTAFRTILDYLLLLNPDNMTEHDRQVMKEIIKIGKEFRISSYGERSMWIWEEPEKNRLLPTKKTLDNYKKIEELSRKAIKELNPTARK